MCKDTKKNENRKLVTQVGKFWLHVEFMGVWSGKIQITSNKVNEKNLTVVCAYKRHDNG